MSAAAVLLSVLQPCNAPIALGCWVDPLHPSRLADVITHVLTADLCLDIARKPGNNNTLCVLQGVRTLPLAALHSSVLPFVNQLLGAHHVWGCPVFTSLDTHCTTLIAAGYGETLVNTALDQQANFDGFVWEDITAAKLGEHPAFTSQRHIFAAALLLAAAKVSSSWLCPLTALRILRLRPNPPTSLTSFLDLHNTATFDVIVSASVP